MIITGKKLRELRKKAGLSQADVARLVGVSQAHIAKIESEKVDPRLSTVNKILFVLNRKKKALRCSDIMTKNIISVTPDTSMEKTVKIMKKFGISQVPVFQDQVQIGSIKESTILKNFDKRIRTLKVRDILDRPFPVVDSDDEIDILPSLLDIHPAVLVSKKGKIVGIITKSDLLEVNAKRY